MTNVKVTVKVGTLLFEDGSFEKGESFIVSKERAALFDPRDVTIERIPKPKVVLPQVEDVETKEEAPVEEPVESAPLSEPVVVKKSRKKKIISMLLTKRIFHHKEK